MLLESEQIGSSTIIEEEVWINQKRRHEERVGGLLDDYLEARSHHIKNPVMDFLFEYYAFRPANLRRWSPGIENKLRYSDSSLLPEVSELKTHDGLASVDPALFPEKRISSLNWMLGLLEKSQSKRPSFGCFGMHEWAMVYKSNNIRHSQVPLRMEDQELAEFVESRPLLCTHFDAFRFFTPDAKPMNRFELSREKFQDMEQPGCIHSNMDLYKWAFKLYPWVPSELILEAFELACEARRIDMKASPYDLREHGLDPIKIETEEGRKIYRREQEAIYEKGKPLREKLIGEYRKVLAAVSQP